MQMEVFEKLKFDAARFGRALECNLATLGILDGCKELTMDHICLRLAKPEFVEYTGVVLGTYGKEISRTMVNGRIISIFELNEPLQVGSWLVRGVELPFPKPNHGHPDGWEHAELVFRGVPNTMDAVRAALFALFPTLAGTLTQRLYRYKESEPLAEGDQEPNPTCEITLRGGMGIKFHALSIQQVVGYAA